LKALTPGPLSLLKIKLWRGEGEAKKEGRGWKLI
jgi:hypothetical protein